MSAFGAGCSTLTAASPVARYLRFAPQCAFVLCDAELPASDQVVGYCLATPDTRVFAAEFLAYAGAELRPRFSLPSGDPAGWSHEQHIYCDYHDDCRFPAELGGLPAAPYVPEWVAAAFPAHLHIDLLPSAQRRGLGTTMMESQLQRKKTINDPPSVMRCCCILGTHGEPRVFQD